MAILAIDTNVKDLRKLREQGIETIQISDERLVRQYLKDHPQYMSWFPNNIFLNNRGMLEGAGQIRAISRLAALAAEEEGKFRPIEEAVRKIAAVTGSGLKENIMTMDQYAAVQEQACLSRSHFMLKKSFKRCLQFQM